MSKRILAKLLGYAKPNSLQAFAEKFLIVGLKNPPLLLRHSIFVFSLLFFVAIFNPHSSFAQGAGPTTANQLFYQGNSAYKDGKYKEAIDNYEKVVSSGLESGNLYYNLGNSYFKNGELGKAVLNYERALFFIPNDSDLKSNYEYILSSLNLGPQSFENWVEKLANRLFEGTTVDFLAILLLVIYIIAILILICYLFFDAVKGSVKILLLVLLALFVFSAVSLCSKTTYFNKGAIVISKEADIQFEPIERATIYFKLTEGNKVEILEKTEDWYKIKRVDGKISWIDKRKLGLI